MFYNLFLPGSVSGDAYKGIILAKKFKAPYKKTTAAVLLDRISGLLALGVIPSVHGIIVLDSKVWSGLLILGSLLAIAALYFVIKFFFKDFIPGFVSTFFWGIGVQGLQVCCLYFILLSLHTPLYQLEWIFIFLVAAVIFCFAYFIRRWIRHPGIGFCKGGRIFSS